MTTLTARLQEMQHAYTAGMRRWASRLVVRIVKLPISPNGLTVTGMLLACTAGVLFAVGWFLLGTAVFLAASLCDLFDGSLARAKDMQSEFGEFLDSSLDRVGEAAALAGVAVHFARTGNEVGTAAAFVAVVAAFLVSYTRAKAESMGIDCHVGLMQRPERTVLLIGGLLFGWLEPVLFVVVLVLAGLTVWTVGQRVIHVGRQLERRRKESPTA
jgi:CDP-diacylglycerol--glycerol-3-phosphate 3-phosphatidyltransferase